jgi:hypothetical protein
MDKDLEEKGKGKEVHKNSIPYQQYQLDEGKKRR